jgi:hypothetical protein
MRLVNPELPGLGTEVPAAGWTQWFLFLGLIEKGVYTYDPTRSPGDFKNAGGPGWLGSWMSWRITGALSVSFEDYMILY